jgi:flavin-dependent dehydrogenase
LVEGHAPVGKIMGLMRMRWFYREATGPGWALIGDAGHFKDFVTGQGMTDAFSDAERLARALLADSREAALEHFWRERDVATLRVHYDALAQGAVGYNSPFMRWMIGHAGKTPAVADRVRHVFDRELEPDELIPGRYLARWMLEALVRGRFDVLGGFFAFGKKLGAQKREYELRRALLARAEARLSEPKLLPASTAVPLAGDVSHAT